MTRTTQVTYATLIAIALTGCQTMMPRGPAGPTLTMPEGGERWVCLEDRYGATASETVVLTRDSRDDHGDGGGEVQFAGVTHFALFSIQGVDRRWDWNIGQDTIVVSAGGRGSYYNFRLADGEGRAKASRWFDCTNR